MKILFLGSPKFAKIILESLLKNGREVVAVICQPDRPADRGGKIQMPEVKTFALENGLKVFQFEKVNNNLEEIKKLDYDLFVTASFGQILSREFLNYKWGVNVHPSLLPDLRGATPIQTALMQGRKFSGVTIQKMVYEVDAGEIIKQQKVEIKDDEDYCALEQRLAYISAELLEEALKDIECGKAKFLEQKGTPTYTKLIKKEDGKLDFSKTAFEIVNQVRALAHNPGCYFEVQGKRVKVLKAKVCEMNLDEKVIANDKKHFIIGTKENAVEILELIAPSGKKMNGLSFKNGLKDVEKVD